MFNTVNNPSNSVLLLDGRVNSLIGLIFGNGDNLIIPAVEGVIPFSSVSLSRISRDRRHCTVLNLISSENGSAVIVNEGDGVLVYIIVCNNSNIICRHSKSIPCSVTLPINPFDCNLIGNEAGKGMTCLYGSIEVDIN